MTTTVETKRHVSPAIKQIESTIGGRIAFQEAVTTSVFQNWTCPDDAIPNQLGPHVVDQILSVSSLEPHTVEILTPDRYLDPRTYIKTELGSADITRRTLLSHYARQMVADGATLVVNGADRFDAQIMLNREYLEYVVGTVCWCNVYFTQTTRSQFGRHVDTHEVLVVQGAGEKHWKVHEPTSGDVVFDDVLTVGDVLYIPRGWDHEVSGTGRSSTHWSFGFNRTAYQWTALAIVADMAKRVGRFEHLNAAQFADAVRDELAQRLAGDEGPAAQTVFAELRAGGSFAFTGTDAPLQDVVVRMAPRVPPTILPTEGATFRLIAAGKVFRIDERLRTGIEMLLPGEPIGAGDLEIACGSARARSLIQWGVANNLIIASVLP